MRPLKILFVRAPRKMWVYVSESDNFWMPLNFPCLSAVLKQKLSAQEVEIKAIDCCAKKIGWSSLEKLMYEEKADIVGFGDETCYNEEALHLARIARAANPKCVIVAGGSHFPYVVEEILPKSDINVTVLGEGEFTFLELVQEILSGRPDYSKIQGIAYVNDNKLIINNPRTILADLDQLPLPDYELMGFDNYAKDGTFWAVSGAVPFFHSRGCFSGCTFCAFWPTESQWLRNEQGDLIPTPTYRTKSVEKTIEEMDILYNKYGRRFFSMIDGTFNAESDWNNRWAEEVLRRGWKIQWFAFQRADCLARDEKLGILEKMVRSGMAYTIVGVERHRNDDYKQLHKINYLTGDVADICHTIQRKYPNVFLQGTFIIGLEDDSREELFRLIDYAASTGIDFPSFHFLSPAPGTLLYKDMKSRGLTAGIDYTTMDWFTPVWATKYMDKTELSGMMYVLMKKFMFRKKRLLKNLFHQNKLKRSIYWWFLRIAAKFFFSEMGHFLLRRKRLLTLQEPEWYRD